MRKKLLRILAASWFLLVPLLLGGGCGEKPVEPKVKMNPNLKFLTRGHDITQKVGGSSADFPVWSPDGSKICYLNVNGNWQEDFTYVVKQIRQIDTSGTNDVVLYEGNYIYLAISPDGTKFATNIDEFLYSALPGGHPVLIDIATGAVDTLPIDSSLRSGPLEFTPSGDSLIYFAHYIDSVNGSSSTNYYWGAFFAFDLLDRTNHLLFTEHPFLVAGLAITPDGKKIVAAGKIRNIDGSEVKELHNVGVWQTISASGDSVIGAFGHTLLRGTYVSLTHLPSDSLIKDLFLFLPEGYHLYSEFKFSPDGKRLALCISKPRPPGPFYSHNSIYILNEL